MTGITEAGVGDLPNAALNRASLHSAAAQPYRHTALIDGCAFAYFQPIGA